MLRALHVGTSNLQPAVGFLVQDWRGHSDEMHSLQRSIEEALKDTSGHLTRLHDEIHRTLEKVATREKYLNTQLEQHLANFRMVQDQLAETKEQYRQASGGVTAKTRILADVRWNLRPGI